MMKAKVKAKGKIKEWPYLSLSYWFELEFEHKDMAYRPKLRGKTCKRKSSAIKAAERVAEDMNLDIVWEK